jgi:hypothetical protein
MMKNPIKSRDPAAHRKAEGALRQRTIRDKTKQVKADRVKERARLKQMKDGQE